MSEELKLSLVVPWDPTDIGSLIAFVYDTVKADQSKSKIDILKMITCSDGTIDPSCQRVIEDIKKRKNKKRRKGTRGREYPIYTGREDNKPAARIDLSAIPDDAPIGPYVAAQLAKGL